MISGTVLRRRRLLAGLGAVAAILCLFVLYLWMKAGWDFAYMVRVLWHQESDTDDYRWKRSAGVAPPPTPSPLPTSDGCATVAAAFAQEPDVKDMESYLRRGGTLSLVVLRDGTIVCEWYGNGGAREKPAAAFSISKTVTSLLLARAVAEGKVASLDDAISSHVPVLARRDARFSAVTLAALVDMRSGIAFDEDTTFPWVDEDAPAVYYASDLVRTVSARTRIATAPGRFVYNDYAPNLVGLVLERAYGSRLAPGPMQTFWNELGAELPAMWSVDDKGFAWHESGLVVTARDLARIGRLMLDGGKVADRQVAPAAFVSRSFEPAGRETVATFAGTQLGYRNGWWVLGDRALVAMGRHGQVMLVAPSTNTVIVRMGKDGHGETNISIARRLERVASRL